MRRSGWRWSATGSSSDIDGGRRGRAGDDPRPQRHHHARARLRPPTRRPTSCSTTSAACWRERRPSRQPRAPASGRGSSFAGVFAVTFCGLVAVGSVLPVLPRYIHGPLGSGDVAVGVVIGAYAVTGLLLRPVAGRFADTRGRKPTVAGRGAAGRAQRLALPARPRARRPDRRPPHPRRRRGRRLHRRLGLDRRPGAAGTARPRARPLRARRLGRAQRRAAARRAAAATPAATTWSGSSPRRCRCSAP